MHLNLNAVATDSRAARAVVSAVLAALVIAQILTPGSISFGFALAVMPLAAAFCFGPVGTLTVGLIVLALLTNVPVGEAKHVDDADRAFVILLAVVAAGGARLRRKREARLVRTTHIADVAQRAVLSPPPRTAGPLTCAALYQPAEHDTMVGGDFYDVRQGPHGVRAVVGDVQGHGLEVVGVVASLLGAFREGALDDPDLPAIAARLERRLLLDKEPGSERFATALLLQFGDPGTQAGILSLGHPPPLLFRDGRVTEVECAALPPLGLGFFERDAAHPSTLPLNPDDLLLAYTDGVSEARDADGQFYPLQIRSREAVDALDGTDPIDGAGELLRRIWDDLRTHASSLDDDVALLALWVHDPADEPLRGDVLTPDGAPRAPAPDARSPSGPDPGEGS